MLLSRPDILEQIKKKKLVFDPPIDTSLQVDQVSVDLRLGRYFTKFKPKDELTHLAAVRADPSIWNSDDLWEKWEADSIDVEPGGFVLGQTLESVQLPRTLAGLIEGRSRFARLGLSMHVTAPKIDPGFHGVIVLEMCNVGNVTIRLKSGDLTAQLMLLELSHPLTAKQLYGNKPDDLFQDQSRPTPARKRATKKK